MSVINTTGSDLFNGFKAATAKGNGDSKQTYSLDEVLCIMAMFQSGLKPKQVSELTGRSVHTLRYKFLEGEIVLNGVKMIRSIRKYSSAAELYTAYKIALPADIDADVKARIQNWKAQLSGAVAPAAEVEAPTDESESTEEVA